MQLERVLDQQALAREQLPTVSHGVWDGVAEKERTHTHHKANPTTLPLSPVLSKAKVHNTRVA